MAKNMAKLDENNVVINIEWLSDTKTETNTLKEVYDYSVMIGDTYENGKFYRNGEIILTPIEEAYKTIDELVNEKEELNSSYIEGVNSI